MGNRSFNLSAAVVKAWLMVDIECYQSTMLLDSYAEE